MDPITTAIVAAIAAGVAGGIIDAGKKGLVEAYHGLKSLLKKKQGDQSRVVQAVDFLEAKPDSAASKALVQEAVAESKADQDPDILQAAQALLAQIKAQPGGEQTIQTATGNYIAQASGGSTASVNVDHPQVP